MALLVRASGSYNRTASLGSSRYLRCKNKRFVSKRSVEFSFHRSPVVVVVGTENVVRRGRDQPRRTVTTRDGFANRNTYRPYFTAVCVHPLCRFCYNVTSFRHAFHATHYSSSDHQPVKETYVFRGAFIRFRRSSVRRIRSHEVL